MYVRGQAAWPTRVMCTADCAALADLLRDKGQSVVNPFHWIQRPSITVGVRSPLTQRLFGLARRMSGKIIPTLFLLENAPFNALRTVSAAADVMRRGFPALGGRGFGNSTRGNR